jgi:hypothetical protein
MPRKYIDIQGLPGRVDEAHVKTLVEIYRNADNIPADKLVQLMQDQYDALRARGASADEAVRSLRDRVITLLVQAWVSGEMEDMAERTALDVLRTALGLIRVTYLSHRDAVRRVESLESWRGATIGSLALIARQDSQIAALQRQLSAPKLPSIGGELSALVTTDDTPTVMFSFKPDTLTLSPRVFRIIGEGPTPSTGLNQLVTVNSHIVPGVSGAPDVAYKDGAIAVVGYSSGPTIAAAANDDMIDVSVTSTDEVRVKWSAREIATDQRPNVLLK